MSGIIGIISNDFARVSVFPVCVTGLVEKGLPEEARVEWLLGGDWCGARNTLAQLTIDSKVDWLWFMDDDHAFAPDILLKLLAHDLPLVVPVCLTRTYPFAPVTFTEEIEDGLYLPLYLPEQPEKGLVKLVAGGSAGMLIKREVFEAIPSTKEKPWFEYGTASEDIIFCRKATEAGYDIYCDLGTRLGHVTTAIAWPATTETGEWVVGFDIGRDLKMKVGIEPRETN